MTWLTVTISVAPRDIRSIKPSVFPDLTLIELKSGPWGHVDRGTLARAIWGAPPPDLHPSLLR